MNERDGLLKELAGSTEGLYWHVEKTEFIADCEVFSVSKTTARSQCGRNIRGGFHTIKCFDWVNVIALTEKREVVFVEQYRHGIRDLTLEIPGGCIDASDANPQEAAARELKEETGYEAQQWTLIGKTYPNPALQDNVCYSFLAEGARKVEEAQFDGTGTENAKSHLIPLEQVGEMIRSKQLSHSLVITAFHFLQLERPDL